MIDGLKEVSVPPYRPPSPPPATIFNVIFIDVFWTSRKEKRYKSNNKA